MLSFRRSTFLVTLLTHIIEFEDWSKFNFCLCVENTPLFPVIETRFKGFSILASQNEVLTHTQFEKKHWGMDQLRQYGTNYMMHVFSENFRGKISHNPLQLKTFCYKLYFERQIYELIKRRQNKPILSQLIVT